MELRDTAEEAAFRAELRDWLAANRAEDERADPYHRRWSRMLYEAGYAGLTWPREFGGAGAPYSFQAVSYEEMALAQAPPVKGSLMRDPCEIYEATDGD